MNTQNQKHVLQCSINITFQTQNQMWWLDVQRYHLWIKFELLITCPHSVYPWKYYLVVIPCALVVCLIYIPKAKRPQAQGLRVYTCIRQTTHAYGITIKQLQFPTLHQCCKHVTKPLVNVKIFQEETWSHSLTFTKSSS